jgi:hypothetical protein
VAIAIATIMTMGLGVVPVMAMADLVDTVVPVMATAVPVDTVVQATAMVVVPEDMAVPVTATEDLVDTVVRVTAMVVPEDMADRVLTVPPVGTDLRPAPARTSAHRQPAPVQSPRSKPSESGSGNWKPRESANRNARSKTRPSLIVLDPESTST